MDGQMNRGGEERGKCIKGPDSTSFLSVSEQLTIEGQTRRRREGGMETTIRKYRILLYSAADRQVGRQKGRHAQQTHAGC